MKIPQICFCFSDNSILNGICKFSLLLREYSQLVVNVLTISPKISYLTKNNFLELTMIKRLIKVLFCRFQKVLGLVNTFTAKGF